MADNGEWTEWVEEPPFEFRFRGPWLNYDGEQGPGQSVSFCGLKCIDFAFLSPDEGEQTLYLMEAKSSERMTRKFRDLDIEPELMVETPDTAAAQQDPLFQARRA